MQSIALVGQALHLVLLLLSIEYPSKQFTGVLEQSYTPVPHETQL